MARKRKTDEELAAEDRRNRTPDGGLDPSELEDQPEEVERNRRRDEPARYRKFRADMTAAGREVSDYQGRFFYDGPAVEVERDELQDVIREATVTLQWDQMGKSGLVVYPA